MTVYCFWILTNGNIIIPDSRHILAVVAVPAAFGETDETIKRTFEEYGEERNSNHEGRAREAILFRIIHRNHIRIRKNQFRRNQYWAVQLYDLTKERKFSLTRWAKYVLPLTNDKYADVRIHQLKDDSITLKCLKLLAEEFLVDVGETTVVITQSELIKMYSK